MRKRIAYNINVKTTSLKVARAYAENEFEAKGKALDAVLPNFDNNYVKLQKRLKKALDIPRIQMPVIEPSDMALFNKRLNEGAIDIFAPYTRGKLYVPTSISKQEGDEWVKLGFVDGSISDDMIRGKLGGISVGKMKPTQSQIWFDKIIKLILQFGPARSGSPILSQTVIVSGDNYLLDGHHRYAQAMIADQGLAMKSLKIPLSIELLLKIGKTYGESIGNSPKASVLASSIVNREAKIAESLYEDVVARRIVAARAIRLDKTRIKMKAKRIAGRIWQDVRGLPSDEPIGKYVINDTIYITNVAGEKLYVVIVVRSNPRGQVPDSRTPRHPKLTVTGGGAGKAGGKDAILVEINANYSPEAFSPDGRLEKELYKLILHELTHIADKFTRGGPTTRRVPTTEEVNPVEYYNKPSEVRAYMQEVVEEVRRYFPDIYKHRGRKDAMKYSLKMSDAWNQVEPHLNRRNRNKILNVVWNEVQDLMVEQE